MSRATPEVAKLAGAGPLEAVISYREHPDGALGADPAARNAFLLESLRAALSELRERLGPNKHAWAACITTFEPAVAVLADPELRAQKSVGPLQIPGSASTPRAHTCRASDFAVTVGPSIRMVMELGAWDNSVAMKTPGQSDDPMNAHYRGLFPLWAEGTYVPLRFSRAAVDRDAEALIHLTPASPTGV